MTEFDKGQPQLTIIEGGLENLPEIIFTVEEANLLSVLHALRGIDPDSNDVPLPVLPPPLNFSALLPQQELPSNIVAFPRLFSPRLEEFRKYLEANTVEFEPAEDSTDNLTFLFPPGFIPFGV